jgi:hypothetical protein
VAPIYRNEDIRQSIQKQEAKLQSDRRRLEGHQLIDKIKHNQFKLTLVADDLQVDTSLRSAARKTVGLETKLFRMRRKLRSEIRSAGGVSEMSPQEAILNLQTCYRGYKIRSLISRAYAERTVVVWDKNLGRGAFTTRPDLTVSSSPSAQSISSTNISVCRPGPLPRLDSPPSLL